MERPLAKADFEKLSTRTRKRAFKLTPEIPRAATAFADRYLAFEQSPAWRAARGAIYGEQVDGEQLRLICGFETPRPGGYTMATIVTGRRGGKSANEACDGVYEAVVRGGDHMRFLQPGQRGYIAIGSRSQRQALEVFRYARGIVEHNAELAALVDGEILESQSGGEITFTNGVVLSVFPLYKSNLRGYTIVSAIIDEFAWLAVDDASANQDKEILAAIRYGMLAPVGAPPRRLVVISSPAGKGGVVYEQYQEHFGKPDAPVLVAHGPTMAWNPSIDPALLEEERKRDPKAFSREVLAEFVDAISAWCDGSVIERACVDRSAEPNPPDGNVRYSGAVDFGFKRDSSVLAIGHLEPAKKDEPRRFVVDGVWRWTPTPGHPLDSRKVVASMASLLQNYGVDRIVGDQFAAIPLAADFRSHGIRFRELTATNGSKFEHFTALKEAFYADRVSLPRDERLLTELRELEERITPGGNIQIGHPTRSTAHDDCASAVCWLLATTRLFPPSWGCSAQFFSPASDSYLDGGSRSAESDFRFDQSRNERGIDY